MPDHALRGQQILHNQWFNRGSAFTRDERRAFEVDALLPARVFAFEEQVARSMANVRRQATDLDRYVYLQGLHSRNATLFYRVVLEHLAETMPIIYTPTVGEACQKFGDLFGRSHGLYLGIHDAGRMAELLAQWPHDDIDVIVVTDGERILGLGDLGVQGMGIPIGKLALYTACAGIAPERCLPVTIDVGTDNAVLREADFYPGLQQPRVRGDAYDRLIDEFVAAVAMRFPRAVLQWEDFGTDNAFHLLDRHRHRIRSFNDDIQGTAAVTLAGLLSATRITGGGLADQRILFLGAGSAATGIGELIVADLVANGMPEAEALRHCWFLDSTGLVTAGRDHLAPHKRRFAHEQAPVEDLLAAVRTLRPTALIGVAAQAGAFTETIIAEMAAHNDRPIVFALSNPTSKAECTAEQAYRWSDGRALFASGSPSAPVEWQGRQFEPRQANNVYVFPGIGLGVIRTQATCVSDEMFRAAAHALAEGLGEEHLERGALYPTLGTIRDTSVRIAAAVAREAVRQGLATVQPPDDIEQWLRDAMYVPEYPPIPADRRLND
ncbi:MAG TPA: NAD-dependent malic enzyme [Gemmatimonadales bacterium]|nr:NAD-dependent malic enzyme [Gemmatimonadales bacterium]